MRAELIAIGTELLLGYTVNTNTAFLSRRLAALGVDCYTHTTVGDNPQRLAAAVTTALRRAEWVITCGGLGPTVDDITLATLAAAVKRPLARHPLLVRRLRAQAARQQGFLVRRPLAATARLGRPCSRAILRQADVPRGAVVLPNRVGTAPGFILPLNRQLLIALPGPPRELEPMVTRQVVPWLARHRPPSGVLLSRTLKIAGLPESTVDERARDLLALAGPMTVGIYAHPGEVLLRVTAKGATPAAARRAIQHIEQEIRRRLGPCCYGADDETLEGVVGTHLARRRQTLAVAESCTGGLLSERLTRISGSSAYFLGGIVAYANAAKTTLLGVPAAQLQRHGAVSEPVALAMATAVRQRLGADYGLAITGIAGPAAPVRGNGTTACGPAGGTSKKPVGLVYLALADATSAAGRQYRFSGDRAAVQCQASQAALDWLRHRLIGGVDAMDPPQHQHSRPRHDSEGSLRRRAWDLPSPSLRRPSGHGAERPRGEHSPRDVEGAHAWRSQARR